MAYDIAKFIKELSVIDLKNAPEKVKYPLSDFLHELDYEHYDSHIDKDHEFIKETELNNLVHGDLNLGNILLDEDNKVVGVIDFCFAGTGNPNMDVARIVSRPAPVEFQKEFLSYFDNANEIKRMKEAWQRIDNGYAEHIKAKFPEINLNQL